MTMNEQTEEYPRSSLWLLFCAAFCSNWLNNDFLPGCGTALTTGPTFVCWGLWAKIGGPRFADGHTELST